MLLLRGWFVPQLSYAGILLTSRKKWPYTYDSCDVGTAPNQTFGGLPAAATVNGEAEYGGALSFLPGQKLSRCTCKDDKTHPGPKHGDGTWVGRAAPEIDVFEAQVTAEEKGGDLLGRVSQSAQWAVRYLPYLIPNTDVLL